MPNLTPEQEYKCNQRERMKSYIIGSKDIIGCKITHIYSKGDEYIVYDYDDGQGRNILRAYIDTEIENDPKNMQGNLNKIKPKLNEFKAVVRKADDKEFAKSVAAQAISLGLTGQIDESIAMFNEIIKRVNNEYKATVKCKLAYLLSCMSWIILTAIIGVILYLNRKSEFLTQNILFVDVYFCALFAGFGGFISVTRKLYNLVIEKDVKFVIYIFYGIERMIIKWGRAAASI